jgi:hypothetical protein
VPTSPAGFDEPPAGGLAGGMGSVLDIGALVLALVVVGALVYGLARYRRERVAWRTPAIAAIVAVSVNVVLDTATGMHALLRWIIALAVGCGIAGLDAWSGRRRSRHERRD